MLKRKILAAVLPVVAAATVVGSGFSAWYFGDSGNASDKNVDVILDVTDSITNAGTLKAYWNNETSQSATGKSAALKLDQGGETISDKFNDSGLTDTAKSNLKGISFYSTAEGYKDISTLTFEQMKSRTNLRLFEPMKGCDQSDALLH